MPEITVAVPVKDRREQMLRCLDALLALEHPSYEVLVLDNCSTDGTAEACRERAAGAAVPVRVEVVEGTVGHVRNRAAELARTELLAFTDSDCLPQPSWLSALVAPLEADPRIGVVCGVTKPEEPPTGSWPATMDVPGWSGRFDSCNIAFRSIALRESDGFDEEVGHFWEDTAAGYAVVERGWATAFAPDAVVLHDVTYPGFWWHVRRNLKQRNLGPVLRRHPEVRDDLLWRRYFLSPRDAKLVAAAGGVVLAFATRRPLALVAAGPYVAERIPARSWPAIARDPRIVARTLLFDGAAVVGAIGAGLRARRVVL